MVSIALWSFAVFMASVFCWAVDGDYAYPEI